MPSEDELAGARERLDAALAKVQRHLAAIPEGGILATELRLNDIAAMRGPVAPDPDVSTRVLAALRIKRPGDLTVALAELRESWDVWTAWAALDDASIERAREAVAQLSAWEAGAPMSLEAEKAYRAAFADAALTRRIDAELDDVREVVSSPNQFIQVNAGFVQQVAAREFDAPIEVRDRRDGATVTARGTLPIRTRLELLENDRDASLRLLVEAQGPISLAARRGKISLCARSQLCLDGLQDYSLTAHGVQHEEPDLQLGSRTRLTGVNADLRLGERIAERVIAKAAAKRLPEADRQATRGAKPKIAERVNEECDDIAYRINGLFQAIYLAPFAAEDVDPAVAFRSSQEGIQWNATYARGDQLGALAPPPPSSIPLETLAYRISLHESAINNLADQLAGTWLDEATYWMLMNEEFKLQSPEVEALPPGRLATAIQFARRAPFVIRVDERTVEITITLERWTLGGEKLSAGPKTKVTAKYRVQPGPSGMQLIRERELEVNPSADDVLASVLVRYLPGELHTRPRFQNAAAPRRLTVHELSLDDGWLTIGVGPVLERPLAAESREVQR